jgi:general stress protein 26
MSTKSLAEVAEELMGRTLVFYMATVDEHGFPQVRAMENLRCSKKFPHPARVIAENEPDPLVSIISTNTSSEKFRQLKANPTVALYYCVPEEYKGVMHQGKAEAVDDTEFKKKLWVEGWEVYYPQGYADPDFTLLRVKPTLLKAWYDFQTHRQVID